MQKKKIKLSFALAVLLLLVVPGLIFLVGKLEGAPPEIRIDPEPEALGVSQEISLSIADTRSGLRLVWAGLVRGDKETVLIERRFSDSEAAREGAATLDLKLPILPQKLGIGDGPVLLRVSATDRSWRNWFHGNRALFEKTLAVDTKPPQIEVVSLSHHINQGGTGLVLYRLSEPCRENGVKVGEHFYPGRSGLLADSALMAGFFALEPRQGPGTSLQLVASDVAGNVTRRGFPHLIKPKVFKQDRIPLGDEFLNAKMPEFDVPVPSGSTRPMLDKFLSVNRQMRDRDHQKLTALGARSGNRMYWQGAFLRLPNSAPRAGFADQRDYLYQNVSVDRQVHLGVDLASLAHSPVPAANTGKVLLAEDVGIYGKTVAIDHGFGLVSLYSHLNHFDVQVGQEVAKGEIIGQTGTTGMAAGDHLHYSMLMQDTFVNPIEWWDEHWIADNVTSKVEAAGSGASAIVAPPPASARNAAGGGSGEPLHRKKGVKHP